MTFFRVWMSKCHPDTLLATRLGQNENNSTISFIICVVMFLLGWLWCNVHTFQALLYWWGRMWFTSPLPTQMVTYITHRVELGIQIPSEYPMMQRNCHNLCKKVSDIYRSIIKAKFDKNGHKHDFRKICFTYFVNLHILIHKTVWKVV